MYRTLVSFYDSRAKYLHIISKIVTLVTNHSLNRRWRKRIVLRKSRKILNTFYWYQFRVSFYLIECGRCMRVFILVVITVSRMMRAWEWSSKTNELARVLAQPPHAGMPWIPLRGFNRWRRREKLRTRKYSGVWVRAGGQRPRSAARPLSDFSNA